ncbi:hypothetical protein AURDEDRAFT_129163 [Auricularia subglabra TFB-10046 SS5]|uniref:Uncharacterized protein n=1 Tax=Auricularia subglabra (strain TFB-10046 / SS5) TaxID=717982 RepID=J0WWF5_AURST|nr:hypothetical protein AURDEDRAFT_129163 [Auricularia subglabra TFB-10046 SS5]
MCSMFTKTLVVFLVAATAVLATPVNGAEASLVKRLTYNDCFNDGYNQGYVAGKHSCGGKKREVNTAEGPAHDEPVVKLEARDACQDKLPGAFNAGFNAGFQAGYKTCF